MRKATSFVLAGLLLALGGLILLAWGLSEPAQAAPGAVRTPSEVERGTRSPSDATPIHYVATTGTDSGDCSAPGSACRSVQYAVDQAGHGDLIKVAAGTYTGVSARNSVTQVVYISKTVAIQGGYTATFAEPPDSEANPTTLDAEGQGRVLYITGNIDPVIENLRITVIGQHRLPWLWTVPVW